MERDDLKQLLARRLEKRRLLLENGQSMPTFPSAPQGQPMADTYTPQLLWQHQAGPPVDPPLRSVDAWQLDQFHQTESKRNLIHEKIRWLNETRENVSKERERLMKLKEKIQVRPLSPPFEETPLTDTQRDTLLEAWQRRRLRAPKEDFSKDPSQEDRQDVPDIVSQLKQTLSERDKDFEKRKTEYLEARRRATEPYDPESIASTSTYNSAQWQLYHWCRGIVRQAAERAMERSDIISPEERHQIRQQVDREKANILLEKAILLVCEEILLEFVYEESDLCAQEVDYCNRLTFNMAHNTILKEGEIIAARSDAGRRFLYVDPVSGAPTQAGVEEYKKTADRMRHVLYEFLERRLPVARSNKWFHEQVLRDLTDDPEAGKGLQASVVRIEFSDLHPVHLLNHAPIPRDNQEQIAQLARHNLLAEYERLFWASLSVVDATWQIESPLSCVSWSRDYRYLAVGMVSGVILVYTVEAPLPDEIYAMKIIQQNRIPSPAPSQQPATQANSAPNRAVVHLEFSHTGDLLAAVYSHGDVILYRLSEPPTSPHFTRLRLQQSSGDFALYSNKLLTGDKIMRSQAAWSPVFVLFDEDLNLLLEPSAFLIGMNSFDVIRVELPMSATQAQSQILSKRFNEPNIPLHRISQRTNEEELRVHLYHYHKSAIVVAAVTNIDGDLVTLDMEGNGALWHLSKDQFGSSGWLVPWKMFHVQLDSWRFFEDAVEAPKVLYDESYYPPAPPPEKAKSKEKPKPAENPPPEEKPQPTEQELAKQAAEEEIERLGLRHPWIRRKPDWKQPVIQYVYRGVSEKLTESGGLFHEVLRHESTDELVGYQQVIYRAHIYPCARFLAATYHRPTHRLVLVLLFQEYEPYYSACVEVIVVSLTLMKAIFPRTQIILTNEEYQKLLVQDGFGVSLSSPLAATGSDYIFINIFGRLECVSLLTGQCVMCKRTPKLTKDLELIQRAYNGPEPMPSFGLLLAHERYQIFSDTRLIALNLNHSMGLLLHRPGTQTLYILRFVDNSSPQLTEQLHKALSAIKSSHVTIPDMSSSDLGVPSELFVNRQPIRQYGELTHKEAAVRELLYEVMDSAIQRSMGIFSIERAEQVQESNRYLAYVNTSHGTSAAAAAATPSGDVAAEQKSHDKQKK